MSGNDSEGAPPAPADSSVSGDSRPPTDAGGTASRGRGSASATSAGPPPGEPHTDLVLPRRFGPYVLLRLLATGGMAELFLAQQRSVAGFEKLLVVKRILPHLARDSVFIEMLLSEARIAATLNHPNIAHVYDVGVHEGDYYIAMEFIRGEDLRSIVRQMRKKSVEEFPLEHAVAVGIGCCAGLAYAHETTDLDGEPLHLVHRDVSPQNVVISFSGDVKLVDFGIAKAGRSQMEDTHAGRLKGKIPYMSPEQASGAELDARSDIFSLGIVLYELSTGRRLFKGPSELETLKMITEGEIPPPRSLNPRVPEALEHILLKLLARNPDDRYLQARDAQADLEAFVRESQLPVSRLSFGAFVSDLFAEDRDAQDAMLQELRQVVRETTPPPAADALPAPAPPSSAPPPATPVAAPTTPEPASEEPRGVPFGRVVALVVAVALAAVLAALFLRPPAAPAPEPEPTPARRAAPTEVPAPDTGNLMVVTSPPGARVSLDGEATGQTTPATFAGLSASEPHALVLERDGYAAHQAAAEIRPGETVDLLVPLTPDPPIGPREALLRLVLTPDDATAIYAGAALEGGEVRERRVRALRGRLAVRKEGFVAQERRLTLPAGEVTEVRVALRPDRAPAEGASTPSRSRRATRDRGADGAAVPTGRGRLVFDARPWCEVTLDGRRLGQTPVVAESLPAGRHRLICNNPEQGLRKDTTVEVRAGETTRMRLELR